MKINAEQFNALVAKLDWIINQAQWLNPTAERLAAIEQHHVDVGIWMTGLEKQIADSRDSIAQCDARNVEELERVLCERLDARNEMLDGMARDMKLIFKLLAEQPKPRRKRP